MTGTMFTEKLSTKFPELLGKGAAELKDIAEFVDKIAGSDLDVLWDEFRSTYTNQGAPRVAAFFQLAKTLNLWNKAGGATQYAWLCHVCNAKTGDGQFALGTWPCPRCGNRFKPWIPTIKAGVRVSRERSDDVIAQQHQGPHPTLGIKRPVRNPGIGKILDKIMEGR